MLSTALRTAKPHTFVAGLSTCFECNGTGYLPEYSHVHGGRCFTCNGTGRDTGKRKKMTTDLHFDHAHVSAFQDALQIEHIHAWVDQDWSARCDAPRY